MPCELLPSNDTAHCDTAGTPFAHIALATPSEIAVGCAEYRQTFPLPILPELSNSGSLSGRAGGFPIGLNLELRKEGGESIWKPGNQEQVR